MIVLKESSFRSKIEFKKIFLLKLSNIYKGSLFESEIFRSRGSFN